MRSSSITLLLSSVVAALVAMAPVTASAREGGTRSIGHGVKCRPATFVIQPDGTYEIQQFCYKGV